MGGGRYWPTSQSLIPAFRGCLPSLLGQNILPGIRGVGTRWSGGFLGNWCPHVAQKIQALDVKPLPFVLEGTNRPWQSHGASLRHTAPPRERRIKKSLGFIIAEIFKK
ncbi:hypothetical protein A3A01_00735 [Candidatus Nomurabacteria bacterium RIFCSPLOWO2_01_FULL_39_17]|uniref:Uncharacterized protein n=1 Tax=Candidatus Nomurabacteria bacterium RIFCSPLOWO2_01_FULL_39_17 TaxID=1801770 RepID=A0A1F6WVS2_9BACT|nr:MAG: hypothetical protein A3A01_00735 [Candidatus Nomurabacteria bacterium RIFCSPLOWO2_01_FULL_39_17]